MAISTLGSIKRNFPKSILKIRDGLDKHGRMSDDGVGALITCILSLHNVNIREIRMHAPKDFRTLQSEGCVFSRYLGFSELVYRDTPLPCLQCSLKTSMESVTLKTMLQYSTDFSM